MRGKGSSGGGQKVSWDVIFVQEVSIFSCPPSFSLESSDEPGLSLLSFFEEDSEVGFCLPNDFSIDSANASKSKNKNIGSSVHQETFWM